jgi:transitional endoplasmic reticulum ATPase
MTMQQVLDKNEQLEAGYKIKFFIEGDDVHQKYRVTGDNGSTYCLIIYNSAKLLKGSLLNSGLLEAEILAQFDTDSIVRYVDSGEMVKERQKYQYIVTNFVSGESLQEKLERDGAFSQYAAVPLVIGLLEALSVLHGHPKVIVHNNVNVRTVALDYSGGAEKPVLSGFHFARDIGSKINSVDLQHLAPFYIAPELYNGVFTPQSDVFSAGALLYHLIIGIPPWHIELPKFQHTQEKHIQAISDSRQKKLTFGLNDADGFLDEHLKETIRKALALDVDQRFSCTQDFIDALNGEAVLCLSNLDPAVAPVIQVEKKTDSGFGAIAGMQELKDVLYNDIIRALNEPELYERYGVTIPNGMLLYGPPGCGKTFIAERFSEEVGFNFLHLKPSDLKSKWVNDTELKIASIFKNAVDNAPSIIFIDEFDAVVPTREGDLHEMNASAVNELLIHMSNCSERGVFVIAASNRPEKIDPAILRTGRIDRIVYLPPPDYEARALMFELYLEKRPVDLGVDYKLLAMLTVNYVSSDIKFIVDEASRSALKIRARITQKTLETVIAESRPSVNAKEIERYELLKETLESA